MNFNTNLNFQNPQNYDLSGQKRKETEAPHDADADEEATGARPIKKQRADDDDDDEKDVNMGGDDDNRTDAVTTTATATASTLTNDLYAQRLAASLASSSSTAAAQPPSLEKFIGGAEAEKIHKFCDNKDYQKLPSYKEHIKTKPDQPFHVHGTQVPAEFGGPLKCSLVIVPNGRTFVLLKGKACAGSGASLRANGVFKSVKTAFNRDTKQLCANCGYDIEAEQTQRLGVFTPGRPATKAALLAEVHVVTGRSEHVVRQVLQATLGANAPQTKGEILKYIETLSHEKIKELMGKVIDTVIRQEVENEYKLQGESDLPATDITEYKSSVTREVQVGRRVQEQKAVRKEPHTILSFFVPLAEGALSDRATERKITGDPVRLTSCVEDMATGLQKLHAKGIAHLDIKFGNLLLVSGHVAWTDFGCAQKANAPNSRLRGDLAVADPVAYEASFLEPQFGEKDFRNADIYSLGLAFYKLLTNRDTAYQGLVQVPRPEETMGSKTPIEDEIAKQIVEKGAVDWKKIDDMEVDIRKIKAEVVSNDVKQALESLNYEGEIRENLEAAECPQKFLDLIVRMLRIDPEGAKQRPNMQEVVKEIESMREKPGDVWLSGASEQQEGKYTPDTDHSDHDSNASNDMYI